MPNHYTDFNSPEYGGTGSGSNQDTGLNPPTYTTQDLYLQQMGVSVDDSLLGFLPGTQKVDTARNRMNENLAFAQDRFSMGTDAMRSQYENQLSQMSGGQGLLSSLGGGFGSRNRGMVKNMDNLQSAYSQNLTGGIMDFQQDILQAQRGYEDAESGYQDSLINRLIQLQQMYKDEDLISFT